LLGRVGDQGAALGNGPTHPRRDEVREVAGPVSKETAILDDKGKEPKALGLNLRAHFQFLRVRCGRLGGSMTSSSDRPFWSEFRYFL
jgi:hypothetical protein